MWKGYDIRKGRDADAFKSYLRTRNFYFEPSQDGNLVHFEVENPDEYVDAWIRNGGNDTTKFVYEFPEGTTLADINLAKKLGLNYLGKAKHRNGIYSYFIEGTLAELKYFADEELGYELHPDYICPSKEFAGIDELTEAGYFEDGKYCDKQMKLTGSKKFKDSDSDIIAQAQKQIDILENLIYDGYDDETGYWKKPYEKYEKIEFDAIEKAVALCNLINVYGGTPEWCPGLSGRPDGYDGPINSRPPKDYPVSLKNNSTVIKMCQQEIDRLVDDELSPLYDEEGEGDWSTPEGYGKQMDIDAKVVALCYVIKAYGGTPEIGAGWDGLAVNYEGPRRSK